MTNLPSQNPKPKSILWIILGAGAVALLLCVFLVFLMAQPGGPLLSFLRTSGAPAPGHGVKVVFQAKTPGANQPSPEAMQEALAILKERARSYGLKSYSFEASGPGQITALLPPDQNLEVLIKNLARTGLVEFVAMGSDYVDEGTEIVTDFPAPPQEQASGLVRHTILTGGHFKFTSVTMDQMERYTVAFELDNEGRNIFHDFTKNNVGKYLAVTLDKEVITDPKISSAIPDGKGIIDGNFTKESAHALAVLLRSKPLPFELEVVSTSVF